MPMNKSTSKQNGKENFNDNHQAGSSTTARALTSDDSTGGSDAPAPRTTRRNPALAPDAEAKRAARRKALTLRALNTAYENHHGQQPRRKTA